MKELLFILTTTAGQVTLTNAPDGWDESLIKWARSDKYWGVFRSFSIPLKFVKAGATALRTEFYTYGTAGTGDLIIQRLNKATLQYANAYVGVVDFGTFKDDDNYVEVNLIDSGIAKALKDNGSTEYAFGVSDPYVGGGASVEYFTNGYINQGSKTFECWDMKRLAMALLNTMTGGGVLAGTYAVKSDLLDYYSLADYDAGVNLYPVCFTTGLSLRHNENNRPASYNHLLKTSFDDFFQTIASVFGAGVGVETIAGVETLVIETRDYFFDSTTDPVILGDSKSIALSVSKATINRMKIGYPEKNSTNYAAAKEPNGESQWKAPNDTSSNQLDLVSKYRADYNGIEECILQGANGSDGADDDIFLIEVLLWPGTPDYFTMKTGSMGRSNVTPLTTWEVRNAGITPRRMLTANAAFIDSLLFSYTGDTIDFTSGSYDMFNVSVRAYSGGSYIAEKLEHTISAPTMFLPLIFEIECALPYTLIDSLNTNAVRRASFTYRGDTFYGWVMEVQAKLSGRGSGKVKLLCAAGNTLTNLVR